ncbi:baseplate J/gp47 family protein [Desulfofundulus thermosubterraneus]|uniref:Uncharacterized phage protein gp47/JayE n=1 Tax=Desulfofundulus thermosubterraneus DSM 16057 TaxID=1121432 RepID=A0A1M6M9S1_9FIRM|nr:baseplate J/gp47 family protein [Desulfofundulus thermosubterraneus]SHJ80159.1 Uncharacterized phage protein gp47/JayE [Desulfofundulus thermosubterraneus DSM 16057]
MAFPKNYEQIVEEIFNELVSAGIIDFNAGSLARTIVEKVAQGLDECWYMLDQVPDRFFIDRARGKYLDRRAREYGMERLPGAKAGGLLVLGRSTPAPFSQLIPAGTKFESADKLTYETTQDATFEQNKQSVVVEVMASSEGSAYNLPAGTLLRQVGVAIPLIETVQVGEGGLTGGLDPEDDESLRQRLLERIRAPIRGGTAADYEAWAKSVAGVATAKCLPLARGPGTVDVLITSSEGIPGQDLVVSVQEYIEQRRPVGANVRVLGPVPRVVDVDVQLIPRSGVDISALRMLVQSSIERYIRGVPIGGIVYLTGIGNAIHDVDGVEDYSINQPAANILLGATEMAIPGIITVE